MSFTTFINAQQLKENLSQANWLLFDCRFSLKDTQLGRAQYEQGHLTGAYYIHLDDQLSAAKTGQNGAHPLPSAWQFQQMISHYPLNEDSQVVIYDDFHGAFAARMWWLLRQIGFKNVAVLEGGLSAWLAAGYDLSTAIPKPQAGKYKQKPPLNNELSLYQVLENLHTDQYQIVDSREEVRYIGQAEPLYAVAGHIPKALNRCFLDNLAENGQLKDKQQLLAEFKPVLTKNMAQMAFYCGSGVTACFNLLVLEHIGLSGAALYGGSWSEWIADSSRPIALGYEK